MTARPISRMIVITPRLDGADGISEVSRQAVAACAEAIGPQAIETWVLDGHAAEPHARRAEGRRARLAGWALAAASRPCDDLLVLVLHVHLLPLAIPLQVRGARLACFLHGIEAWRRLRPRERAALTRTTTVIANSRVTAERFRTANPSVTVGIDICPLGVRDAPQAELPAMDGYALIVGRIDAAEQYKGHELLISIWPHVVRAWPSARLVVVGDGDDRSRLERIATASAAAEQIIFAGRVSDAQREGYYRNAAFFVMPSTGEGFGLTYVEAMRAGKPCIAAPGAAAEIIEDGVTGLIVDPASPQDVTAAVVRLFADGDLSARMGRSAAARVAAEFDARHFAGRLVSQLGLRAAQAASA